MIRIDIEPERVEISGHAGYAPIGYDIVCASVSTLFWCLIEHMKLVDSEGFEYECGPGRACVRFRRDRYKDCIKIFVNCLSLIASEFPNRLDRHFVGIV